MTTLWASDTNYSDPGQAWDGQPTKVTPTAGQITQGFLPGRKVAMEWLNWAITTCGGRISAASDEYVYTTPKLRTKRVPLHWGRDFGSWGQSSGGVWTSPNPPANNVIEFPISDLVPSGCTLTSVAAKIFVPTSNAGANRVQISAYKSNSAASSSQIGTTGDDGGATGVLQVTTPGFSEVIDLSTYEYYIRIKAANGGSANQIDSVLVAFTDIGPRNF